MTLLIVTSTVLDTENHRWDITLSNVSKKTVAAWALSVSEQTPTGPQTFGIGFDNYFYGAGDPNDPHDRGRLIQPDHQFTYSHATLPGATEVIATVVSVIYTDRTSEGDPASIASFFSLRRQHAERLLKAANILTTSNIHDAVEQLRDISGTQEILYETLHVPADVVNNRSKSFNATNAGKEEIATAISRLRAEAAFYLLQSAAAK